MLFQHRNLGVVLQDFLADIQGEESKEAEEFELFKRASQERRGLEAQFEVDSGTTSTTIRTSGSPSDQDSRYAGAP